MTDTVREFLVPDLGEGLESATIVEWLVDADADIEVNQPLCVVETEKAEVEIPSPFAGRLVERRGEAGETMAVGTVLARIATAPAATLADAPPELPPDATPEIPEPTPGPRRQSVLVGYGADDDGDRSRRPPKPTPAATAATTAAKPLAKPPVRKLARTLGVDLAGIAPGSGPGGVITRGDVNAAAEVGPVEPAPAAAGTETVPVRGVRARIAERMTRSRNSIPDATGSVVADGTRLIEVREALNAGAERIGRRPVITPFALICRLLVQSLRSHPMLNASFDEEASAIRVHNAVHLGVATSTDRGLLVPVVRDAQGLTTIELAEAIGRLATGAREATLGPDELSGSTFTVSNLGALGLDEGIPVINHPEAAILGIGSIRPRPVVVDGAVLARTTATLTCAFDHRVCDGAEVGAFLSRLRSLVEAPEMALLES